MGAEQSRAASALAAARAGGAVAEDEFRSAVTVETKANKNDVVTWIDRAAQEVVIDRIRDRFPTEHIVAEESTDRIADGPDMQDSGTVWIVDPIDGTANYVRGMRVWATSVAVVRDGSPIAAATVLPAMGDEYRSDGDTAMRNGERATVSDRADPETFAVAVLGWGPQADRSTYTALSGTIIERFGDFRRLGSMQTALAMIASGELDGAITNRPPTPWDSIAGAHLIDRAGGTVTDLDGPPWRYGRGVLVASNGNSHEALIEAARAALDAR